MIWNEKIECASLDQMQALQLAKLQETVAWVYDRVPFYRNKFDSMGLKPDDVKSLEDLAKLPLTVKTDLRDNYPFGLCAVPMDDVVKIHASSGTTGKPITGPYTADDINQWRECVARNLHAAGVFKKDIVQVAYGYGLFTGGLGLQGGCDLIGCATIPASSGMTERQVTIMRDFGSTVLCCTPSYALTIAEKAADMGVDIRELPLRVGVFGAEPWTVEMRQEIEERMGIRAHEVYGLTELMGPSVSFDCQQQDGFMHINEDHVLAEVIDPVTEEVLPLGEKGELVFTAIQRRAMPLLRYRTRDITELRRETCSCGRTLLKMKKVLGRSDDMLIISGVNVFPSQVESILLEVPEVEPQYVLIIRKKGYLDALSVDVEAKAEVYDQGEEKLQAVEKRIEGKIRGTIGIGVKVRLVPPKSIERSEGKAKRVFDARKL
ncbi:Phenylacetate--CoA ligase [Desulfarculus baarsii DSM 2075]|uniref:Phenylacetate-coenzyme A ligase n=1 Tax=Desulfarculus baarsii (strain ATCC 33931 / DSM 2075 / LMG 7858 / VKM B-1802 / 2st14) TaxID=644282 RepID=E1QF87_DESB2|nr:phenylacetate--CoA ligase [Desulfarculus baarsii]ADK84223.1 Phenylacetate--CoA ligase [Desulfarculus baarsii DSM 2075]